jgi:hypothetical protein
MRPDDRPKIKPSILAKEQQKQRERELLRDRYSHPLLSQRSAFVLTLALLVAIGAGVLLYAAHHSIPLAVLGAGGAFGVALPLFNSMIEL